MYVIVKHFIAFFSRINIFITIKLLFIAINIFIILKISGMELRFRKIVQLFVLHDRPGTSITRDIAHWSSN